MRLISELKQIADDYDTESIEITDGLTFSQKQTLRMIDFYSASRYLQGKNVDGLGMDIPFYNIVNTMVDTAVVATDIDTKDIVVEADDENSYDKSFMFNHEIQQWMKDSNFAEDLNEMGETRARYGGVLIKKCMEEGTMEIEVVDWKNLITDPVDIEGGVIIERHFMTPMELRAKAKVWNNVEDAIDLYGKKGYTRSDERIEVWEVEGEFSDSYLAEDAEYDPKDEYSRQHHFYCVKGNKTVHLFWEQQKDSQYKYLAWKKVAGRSLGRGVIEEGEEAQVWTNDAKQKEQAAMDLASKIIIKTNSKKVGSNIRTEQDNGSIVVLEDGKEMDVLNLLPSGVLTELSNMKDSWWSQYERATSSYDAQRGETPPSGQPYRLQALVAQQSGSHFDYRREEWGIFLKEVFYDWVFPYIQKKLNKAHILASDFSPEELAKLDEAFATYEANNYAKDKILNGEPITREQYLQAQTEFKTFIGKNGKRRFLDIPDGYYKDMKAKLSINITGEQKNKQAAMETLSNILQTMNLLLPTGVVNPEDVKMVINKIFELTGGTISPLSLSKGNTQQQMQAPQGQPQQPGRPQPGQFPPPQLPAIAAGQ